MMRDFPSAAPAHAAGAKAKDNDDNHGNAVELVDIDKIAQEVLTPAKEKSLRGLGAGNTVKKDATAALYPIDMLKLPSTRDRVCILGCLAGVLSSGGTARFPSAKKHSAQFDDSSGALDQDSDDENSKEATSTRGVYRVSEQGAGAAGDELAESENTASSRRDSSAWNYFNDTARQTMMNTTFRQRAVEVNKEMLEMVAELLLLDKSTVKAFIPLLSMNYSKGNDNDDIDKDNNAIDYNIDIVLVNEIPGATKSKTWAAAEKDKQYKRVRRQQELMRPFLDELVTGSGVSNMALLLFRLLLTSTHGYDARVRTAFREVAVQILAHDAVRMQQQQMGTAGSVDVVPKKKDYQTALLKFEALETAIASHLTELAKEQQERDEDGSDGSPKRGSRFSKAKGRMSRKESLVRAAKVGTVGLAAGALFAFTGGLAAPAIAAGIATLAGTTAIGITAMGALSSATAVTIIFGGGGGLLAANKMKRRVKGLTDFTLQRETEDNDLFATIGIAGWLRDGHDFQRSWGVTPNDLDDKTELLERFYAIFRPDYVPKVEEILLEYEGKEDALWAVLADTYGRDPDSLLPLYGSKYEAALSSKELTMVDEVLTCLGYLQPNPNIGSRTGEARSPAFPLSSSLQVSDTAAATTTSNDTNVLVDGTVPPPSSVPMPRDGYPVWDYSSEFGGELYTVQWESKLLLQISDESRKFASKYLRKAATSAVVKVSA
jgi:hypothetical protein